MTEPAPTLDPAPALRVSNAADLIELVPYLVGFHPDDSIVFVGLHGPRERVGMTLRLDLEAATAAPDSLLTCAGHLARSGAAGVIVVIYGQAPSYLYDDGSPALPHSDVVVQLAQTLGTRGLALADALLVIEDRWWSFLCTNTDCCPAEGHQRPAGDAVSAVAAAAAVAGMTVAADRDTIVHSLAPLPAADRADLRIAVEAIAEEWSSESERSARRAGASALWTSAVQAQRRGESVLEDSDAAALLVALRDVYVRDACCTWAAGPDARGARALARQLARRASPPWDVAPYSLVAWFAWRDGEGALAQIAVERAIASDPSCTFARLIQELLDRGVDPRVWRDPPDFTTANEL